MLAYYGTQISPNQIETDEGYLICRNVPIARTGQMEYLARELQLDGDPERIIQVNRRPEDVFEAAALASFEGKPVTDGHPPENVGPENYSNYLRGHVEHVRRDGDFVVADLYINDAALADQVQNGVKREVSCGYLCEYTPDGEGYRQSNIRGNHVAVVPRGRAGHEVAIKDAAQEAEKGRIYMSKFTEAVLSALGMAAREAKTDEEMAALVSTTATVLDAEPDAKADGDKPAEAEKAEDAAGGTPEWKDALDAISKRLEALEHKEESHDADGLDSLVKELEGEGKGGDAAVIPADSAGGSCASPAAKDAALAIVKAMRPVVASIQDKATQTKVTDALLSALRGPDVMGQIAQAAQASAQKAADQAAVTSYEQRCADSQAAYAARNPHKRQEKEA